MASCWDFFGIRNRDFLFKARSKNPGNPEIPGIGIGIRKSRKNRDRKIPKIPKFPGIGILKRLKNPEKIPSAKSRKFRNPGDRDWDLKIPIKSRKNPKKSRVKNPENLGIRIYFSLFRDFYPRDSRKIPGIRDYFGIFYLRDIPEIFLWDLITYITLCNQSKRSSIEGDAAIDGSSEQILNSNIF